MTLATAALKKLRRRFDSVPGRHNFWRLGFCLLPPLRGLACNWRLAEVAGTAFAKIREIVL